jgi:cytochrome c peroxidase
MRTSVNHKTRARTVAFTAAAILVTLLCSRPFGLGEASDSPVDPTNTPGRRFKIARRSVDGFPEPRPDSSKVAIGERLFLETRFSQFYFASSQGDANSSLPSGDPVVATTVTATNHSLRGPFAGFAINCRSCHLVNEHYAAGWGNRTYADFARRSPVPAREDGQSFTVRNSPAMVNATIPRERDLVLHSDGEFISGEDLVIGTFSGRNFGWLPRERDQALRHIAHIIRKDDGRGPLALEFGGISYRRVLAGTDPQLGEEGERFRLPEEYRMDVGQATDQQIVAGIARLVTAYMDSLFFSRDERGEYDASPYDTFLETNQLPRKPDPGQSQLYYNRNLANLIERMPAPDFVSPTNGFLPPMTGRFKTLRQEFRFGREELMGMKIFFAMARYATNAPRPSHGIGNCVACHSAPDFTDFSFHNTGAAQEEYDTLHGAGAFARLKIPDLAERTANPESLLPPSPGHPKASGPFLAIPTAGKPGRADLGLWNVFANPDQPLAQLVLRRLLNGDGRPMPDEELLPRTVALFKTPSLRGLAFSAPYLHTGSKDSLEEMIEFYRKNSNLARADKLRNASPEMAGILLKEEDVAPLAAFLRSLNEDYE